MALIANGKAKTADRLMTALAVVFGAGSIGLFARDARACAEHRRDRRRSSSTVRTGGCAIPSMRASSPSSGSGRR
jgi:hypothetical protein